MLRNAEVRHKRVYGCRKKRLNTGRFFDNHCKPGAPHLFPRFTRSVPGNAVPLSFTGCGEKIQSTHFAGDR